MSDEAVERAIRLGAATKSGRGEVFTPVQIIESLARRKYASGYNAASRGWWNKDDMTKSLMAEIKRLQTIVGDRVDEAMPTAAGREGER